MRRIQRALISVYDKTGVVEFATELSRLGTEIISTGGTSRLLRSAGVPVREVSNLTGYPEILNGRVKTLHPQIAGGLLAVRENPEHMKQIAENHIALIDLLCVNLYPFLETTRRADVLLDEVIENIDIGGPTLIRAAAKNYQDVAVVTSPADYLTVIEALKAGNGVLDPKMLFDLSRKAFARTARYDGYIAQYLSQIGTESSFSPML